MKTKLHRFLANTTRGRLIVCATMIAAAVTLGGCTVVSYSNANGEHFSRLSLGASTAIAGLEVQSGTNGLRQLRLQGYQNENSQALGTVTEAAVRAALQGAK
jgi:hypothetical protein